MPELSIVPRGAIPIVWREGRVKFYRLVSILAFLMAFQFSAPQFAAADEVLDWNTIAVRAVQVPPAVPPFLHARVFGIVQVAVFDAVNGIEHRYKPIHFEG